MICPNCGHRVRDGAKFCDECGIVLPETTAAAASPEPAQPSAPPRRLSAPMRSTEPMGGGSAPYDGGMLPPPIDMTRARRIFALVAIGLVAILCFCCALAVGSFLYLTQNPASMLLQ
jgi:zinc-ribbon domain